VKLKGKGISVLIISIMLFSMIGSCAYAVNSSDDDNESNIIYVNPHGNDAWNGLAPEFDNETGDGPKKTIKSALNEVSYEGTIKLAPGTYHENEINVESSVTIEGSGATNTKIDGKRGQVFNIVSEDYCVTTATIQDLSIENAQSTEKGSAIYNSENCELTIKNCNFKNNYKSGAIENNGQVLIDNCNFDQNKASCGGALSNCGEMTIKNSDFDNNQAISYGGAIYNSDNLKIEDCEFSGNHAGIGEDPEYSSSGGAIYNEGSLDIKKSLLSDNSASDGGAIYSCNALYVEECNLKSNYATHGGAIYTTGDYMEIQNNRFNNNYAEEYGGAIATISEESISNNKFKNNEPEDIKIIDMV
jgi:predicted outer membrane repeat protein